MYEWLNGYQTLEQEIYYLDWELDVSKKELERWCDPMDLGKYSLTKESRWAKLEEIIADQEKRLAHKMNQIYDLRNLIYSFKGLDQHILRMKYIEGLTLKEIALELKHEYGYIRKTHTKIIHQIPKKEQ